MKQFNESVVHKTGEGLGLRLANWIRKRRGKRYAPENPEERYRDG